MGTTDNELLQRARETARWEDISALADMAETEEVRNALHEMAWLKCKREERRHEERYNYQA